MRTSAPRSRPSFSCILCRQRRVKCDRAKPSCGNCVKAKVACEWHPSAGLNGASPAPSSDVGYGLKRQRVEDSEEPHHQIPGHSGAVSFSKYGSIPPSIPEYPSQLHQTNAVDLRELEIRMNKLTQLLSTLGYSDVQSALKDNQSSSPESENAPRRAEGVNNQVWNYIIEEVQDLNKALRGPNRTTLQKSLLQENHENAVKTLSNVHTNKLAIGHGDLVDAVPVIRANVQPMSAGFAGYVPDTNSDEMKKLVKEVPNRFQCNLLWNTYIECAHPTYPIFHLPDMHAWYRTFWDLIEFNGKNTMPIVPECPQFFVVLFSCLYIGARVIRKEPLKEVFTSRVPRAELLARLMGALETSLRLTDYAAKPTVLQFASYFQANGYFDEVEPSTEMAFLWNSIQKAYALELHRSPRGGDIPLVEQEIRRRLWWILYGVDANRAILNGSPLIASNDEAYDHTLPSVLKDEYIHLRDDPNAVADEKKLDPLKLAMHIFHESTIACRKIIRTLQQVDQFALAELEKLGLMVYELRKSCAQHIQKLNRMKHFASCSRHITYHRWSSVMISARSDNAMCLLYQPFLKGTKCSLWPYSRTCALRAAHSLMRKVIFVAIMPEYDFIYRAHRRCHLPLQATMIVLVDLYERPSSEEALNSRVLVDKIFELVDESEHRSIQRLAYRWNLLRKLRKQAYARAGINAEDPEYLRTSASMLSQVVTSIDDKVDPLYACPAELSLADEEIWLAAANSVLETAESTGRDSGTGSPDTPGSPEGIRTNYQQPKIFGDHLPGLEFDDLDDPQHMQIVVQACTQMSPDSDGSCNGPVYLSQNQQHTMLPHTSPMQQSPVSSESQHSQHSQADMQQLPMQAASQQGDFQWDEWGFMFGDYTNVEIDEGYLASSDFFQGKISYMDV